MREVLFETSPGHRPLPLAGMRQAPAAYGHPAGAGEVAQTLARVPMVASLGASPRQTATAPAAQHPLPLVHVMQGITVAPETAERARVSGTVAPVPVVAPRLQVREPAGAHGTTPLVAPLPVVLALPPVPMAAPVTPPVLLPPPQRNGDRREAMPRGPALTSRPDTPLPPQAAPRAEAERPTPATPPISAAAAPPAEPEINLQALAQRVSKELDIDKLTEHIQRQLRRRLAIEGERRGWSRWT